MQRRLADLAGYNFVIKHVSGKSDIMQTADFLSRYPYETKSQNAQTQTDTKCDIDLHRILRVTEVNLSKPVTTEEIKAEYTNDKILSTVIGWLKNDDKPNELNHRNKPDELCHYWKDFNLLKLKDGILYRKWINPNDRANDTQIIVVPCTLVERILYSYHNTLANCHSGVDTSLEQCSRKFYFYKMKYEFKLYISACLTCNRNKQPKTFLKAPLRPIIYSYFGQAIAIDHLEPSKTATARGVIALLTIVDAFSNYLVCVPVKSTSTEESIKAVIEHWILKHGFPEAVQHDLGSGFTSGLWKAVMTAFDIKDNRTTPKFSQINGKAEAQNRKINISMRVTLGDDQWQNYDIYIKYIVFCLNSLVCSRSGYSPNFVAFGRELLMPRDLFVKNDNRLDEPLKNVGETDYKKVQAYKLYKHVSEITRKVRDNAQKRAMYMCKQYDKHVKGPYFNKGDLCFLLVIVPKHKYADT